MHRAEHRKTKRRKCAVPVEGKTGSAFESARLVDISRQGMGFLSAKEIPPKIKIGVEIDSQHISPIVKVGEVCWSKPATGSRVFRVGMKFI